MKSFPHNPSDYLDYQTVAHTVLDGEFFPGYHLFTKTLPDLNHVFWHENVACRKFSSIAKMPSLFYGVILVVLMGSKEKVRRIYTSSIVAVMAHEQSWWNRTFKKLPSQPTSNMILVGEKRGESSITGSANTAHPIPANIVWKLWDFSHESFSEGFGLCHKQNAHQPEKVIPANGGRSLQKVGKSFVFSIRSTVSRLTGIYSILKGKAR